MNKFPALASDWIWGAQGGDYEEYSLLGYDAVQYKHSPTFQRYISPPSSGSKCKLSENQQKQAAVSASSAGFLLGLHFDPEDGGHTCL
jgi:hypothetical protein